MKLEKQRKHGLKRKSEHIHQNNIHTRVVTDTFLSQSYPCIEASTFNKSIFTHHLERQKARRKEGQKGNYFYSELQTGTLMVMKQVLQMVEVSSVNRERMKIKHVSKLLREK